MAPAHGRLSLEIVQSGSGGSDFSVLIGQKLRAALASGKSRSQGAGGEDPVGKDALTAASNAAKNRDG
jgi:hypothetical protein